MLDSSNNYAKYKPQMEFPVNPGKPKLTDYNMDNPDTIREYADSIARYNKENEEYKQKMLEWRKAESNCMKLFHDNLLQNDLNDGIALDALEAAYSIAYNHGHSFYEFETIYEEVAEIARLAHRGAIKK